VRVVAEDERVHGMGGGAEAKQAEQAHRHDVRDRAVEVGDAKR
jgi:hypothetical protein